MNELTMRREVLIRGVLGAAASSLALPTIGWAQSAPTVASKWPVEFLKVIIPAPPGGGVDSFCRALGERLSVHLGVRVVPDNKPGAAGLLGTRAIALAPPDGSTIGLIHSGLVSVQAMGGKLDLLKDVRPIVGRLNESQYIIAVRTDSKYTNLSDLLKDITARPGKLNYGTGGLGSPGHMVFEKMKEKLAALKAQDVPFKGAIESVNALISKDLDFVIGVMSTVQVQVKSGRLRALAVTGISRSELLPEVPTIAESDVAGFSYVSWGGVFAPSKMPDHLVAVLQEAMAKIVKEAAFKQFVLSNGSQISPPESLQEFQIFLRESIEKETAVMTKLGLKAAT